MEVKLSKKEVDFLIDKICKEQEENTMLFNYYTFCLEKVPDDIAYQRQVFNSNEKEKFLKKLKSKLKP